MNEAREADPTPRHYGPLKSIGWVVSFVGMGLWVYGYFVDGGVLFIDWPRYIPDWAAAYVPNREAEIGFALSMIGMIPIYYVAFLESKAGNRSN